MSHHCFNFTFQDVPVGPVGHYQEEQEHDEGGVGEHEVGEQGEEGEALAHQVTNPISFHLLNWAKRRLKET